MGKVEQQAPVLVPPWRKARYLPLLATGLLLTGCLLVWAAVREVSMTHARLGGSVRLEHVGGRGGLVPPDFWPDLASAWAESTTSLDLRQLLPGLGDLPPRPAEARGICLLQLTTMDVNSTVGSTSTSSSADDSMLAWWLYALRHGHRYVRLLDKTATTKGQAMWHKPLAAAHVLESGKCEVVVFIDLDVAMADWTVPFNALLRRWNWTESGALIMMAEDPDEYPRNYVNATDGRQLLMGNTGFIVFRNTPRTLKILRQWRVCPDAIRKCRIWRHRMFYDQSAFNMFVRPALAPGEIKMLPCSEANGYPFVERRWNCTAGRSVQHYWGDKPAIERRFKEEFDRDARLSLLAAMIRDGGLQPLYF